MIGPVLFLISVVFLLFDLPAMLPNQVHKTGIRRGPLASHLPGSGRGVSQLDEALRIAAPDGDHETPSDGQLLHQHPGDRRRTRRHRDGIERGFLAPPVRPVSHPDHHVVVIQGFEQFSCLLGREAIRSMVNTRSASSARMAAW